MLFVDDDVPLRALLKAIAVRNQWRAVMATDGREALNLLARDHYDAIVLDLLLPEVNGFDVLRHLKCTRPGLLKKTVVISAATPTTTIGCSELSLVRKYLRKPFDIAALETEVACCFESPERDRRPVEGAQAEHDKTGRRSSDNSRRVS